MTCLLRVAFLFLPGLQVFDLMAQSTREPDLLVQWMDGVSKPLFQEKTGIPSENIRVIDSAFRLYTILQHGMPQGYVLSRIETSKTCRFWQHLNSVRSRSVIPNDPFFAQQTQYAKNRIADVWPYMNGGTNRRGDTLVVAIVDSGRDTLHPDLKENEWVNTHEIPDNRIDDDSNGYIDDVLGWNGGDDTNRTYTQVTLDGHGNAIAGIIGARGNNAEGIAGMNWNLNVMPVVCYPEKGAADDIGVVRSLIYVYRMKKIWLESQGNKGANIVAVNTSIGIDQAFPGDAPVWCSLYDSLGTVGVVASAATTNNSYDVGQKGDIPSTCPSRFMIVVNSTDQNDNLVSSGYSIQYVDLAAQGAGVFTTSLVKNSGSNGPYSAFNGTSFAAPQISGTIALLYQHACDTFLNLTDKYPDSAASLMVKWILDGSDPLAVLNGITVSGGRLNVYGAFHEMDLWCTLHDVNYGTRDLDPESMQLYPSPVASGGEVNIRLSRVQKSIEVQMINLNGGVVLQREIHNSGELKLPASVCPGVYYIRIRTDNQCMVRKLLII